MIHGWMSRGRGRVWRRSLIALASLQALAVLVQAWLAGGFLTGLARYLEIHRNMAFGVIQWIGLVALVVALLLWRPGHGPAWPIVVSVVSLVAIGFQIAVGFANLLQVHIPLGMSIFGLNLWLAVRLAISERKEA